MDGDSSFHTVASKLVYYAWGMRRIDVGYGPDRMTTAAVDILKAIHAGTP